MTDPTQFVMPFGKYKGETLEEIYVSDKQYLEWLSDNSSSSDVAENIDKALEILKRKLRVN